MVLYGMLASELHQKHANFIGTMHLKNGLQITQWYCSLVDLKATCFVRSKSDFRVAIQHHICFQPNSSTQPSSKAELEGFYISGASKRRRTNFFLVNICVGKSTDQFFTCGNTPQTLFCFGYCFFDFEVFWGSYHKRFCRTPTMFQQGSG